VPQRLLRVGADWIPRFQPLWESLHRHHAAVAPHLEALGPVRRPEDSWAVRRGLYEEWLAEPDAFALVALVDEQPVGYAVVHMRPPEETWATGDPIAELETLAVLPEQRGRGIGSALMKEVFEELRRVGVKQWAVGAISTNADAIRFYERLGVLPFVTSFMGAVPPGD